MENKTWVAAMQWACLIPVDDTKRVNVPQMSFILCLISLVSVLANSMFASRSEISTRGAVVQQRCKTTVCFTFTRACSGRVETGRVTIGDAGHQVIRLTDVDRLHFLTLLKRISVQILPAAVRFLMLHKRLEYHCSSSHPLHANSIPFSP